jgi:Tfp pilus assembly major pilin PilA
MKITNEKGITILALIIWVVIIGAAVLYAPKGYQYVIELNTIRIITSNVKSVEAEIRSELLNTHPVHIWNNIDGLIKNLHFQNPVTRNQQTANGWDQPGDVAVSFDGINTFRLDGIGRDGSSLRLNIIVQRTL